MARVDAGLRTFSLTSWWYRDLAESSTGRLLLGGSLDVEDGGYCGHGVLAEWSAGRWKIVDNVPLSGVEKIEPIGDTSLVLSGYDDVRSLGCVSRWDGHGWKTAITSEPPFTYWPAASIALRQSGEVCAGKYGWEQGQEAWIRVRFESPPIIERQPVSATISCRSTSGYIASVVVPEEMRQDARYVWRRDGVPIDSYAGPNLELWWADGRDCGTYDCIVSNGCGQVVSDPIEIRVVGCRSADWNQDGLINAADFDGFLRSFESGERVLIFDGIYADFNRDGFLDFEDFDEFVRVFEHGC